MADEVGLFPPLEHRDLPMHWLRALGGTTPRPPFLAYWHSGEWSPIGDMWRMSAADADGLLIYVGPVLPPGELVRENEDLREVLSETLRASLGAAQVIEIQLEQIEALQTELRALRAPVAVPPEDPLLRAIRRTR